MAILLREQCLFLEWRILMNKEQIKEAILGQPNCRKEDTPLCQFATFHPDMEMVEILLKGADIQKSFNNNCLIQNIS